MTTNVAPWLTLAQILKSRPFLFCLLIFLVVFLMSHFVSPPGDKNTAIDNFPVPGDHMRWIGNKHTEDSIASKSMSLVDKSMDIETNGQQTYVQKIQENKLSKEFYVNTCREKKFDVSFLKVHKAGSTTLMNIFLRFAIENKLNIVLPRQSSGYYFNYLGYGVTVFKENIIPLLANETYNILCNHVVYNREAFHSIMPKDTVYLGIIREPVSHFISAANYYYFYHQLRSMPEGRIYQEKVVSNFLKNPSQTIIRTDFVYNRMCFDFGIPKQKFHDVTYVTDYIDQLKRDYSLVLILEYFHESLVLMKRILCWDTKDILYVPLNKMEYDSNFNLDNTDVENLRKWNNADFKLYESFSAVFDAKVESYGEDFKEEVRSFKKIQKRVRAFCFKAVNQGTTVSVFRIRKNKWGTRFNVTVGDCRLMMEPELNMMNRLIENAWLRYNNAKV